MENWRQVIKDWRYIRKRFKDPYKILVAADKYMDELERIIKTGEGLGAEMTLNKIFWKLPFKVAPCEVYKDGDEFAHYLAVEGSDLPDINYTLKWNKKESLFVAEFVAEFDEKKV